MVMQLPGKVAALCFLNIHEAFRQFSLALAARPDLVEQFRIFDRAGSLICQTTQQGDLVFREMPGLPRKG
jgi:hypothetical protein